MPLARVICRAQIGLTAPLVHVEVSLGEGLPAFFIVGLPATVVKESKERVRAALLSSGFQFPAGRITVSLAPADLPKEGGRFDLPIALGILLASEQIRLPAGLPFEDPLDRGSPDDGGDQEPGFVPFTFKGPSPSYCVELTGCEFYGELSLNGELKSTHGLLLAAAHAVQVGNELVVPRVNVSEASNMTRARVRGAVDLLGVCAHVERKAELEVICCDVPRVVLAPSDDLSGDAMDPEVPPIVADSRDYLELRDIRGQSLAKRALFVAAAGGHSLLFFGVPGTGKSTLARRLPELLPPLTEAEALEVASITSVSTSGFDVKVFGQRPFRSPHHTASAVAIIGGGGRARPGEVSLAHHGVLFLDELPEFDRRVLEALREPLETGEVAISRAALQTRYPAAFQLVAAMNPCPCGYLGDTSGKCHCSPDVVARYRHRISGPLLDRLDLQVELPRVPTHELLEYEDLRESHPMSIAARVRYVRGIQARRQRVCNARLGIAEVNQHCLPNKAGRSLIERAADRIGLSARGYHRILKVARTIADLEGEERVLEMHVAEAIALRRMDRRPLG
ncbi:MAG TPA: YifB family Mg chelatase-like AAA ATPase [Steroidobacteraceae bacterium]